MRCRSGQYTMGVAWRNVDDCEPQPAWLLDVALHLTGGRFAVETRGGTVIAELGDWIVKIDDGRVYVTNNEMFQRIYREVRDGK